MHELDAELDTPIEPRSQLVKHETGPWISRGGYLDYESWPDRDRFKELDGMLEALRLRDDRILSALAAGATAPEVAAAERLGVGNVRMIKSLAERGVGRFKRHDAAVDA